MDDKIKGEFILLFNQGFEEVIMPQIENLSEEINQRFDKLEARVDTLDRKLDRSLDHEVIQNNRLDKIKSVPIIAHQIKK